MDATARFAELVAAPDGQLAGALDEATLLIAAHARPELDIASYLAQLDAIAAGAPEASADAVLRHVFLAEGFAGDTETYYDARNSYLDQVIDRRRGIPITLAIVLIEVGRRRGIPFVPIGMPGHFLVQSGATLLDPFERGKPLSMDDCEARFRATQGDAPFSPSLLVPATAHDIVARVLANLRQIHLTRRDSATLEWVLRLRGLLPGATIEERAERAGVLAALGRFDTAADLLEALAPEADEARGKALETKARQLRARLN